MNFQLTPEQIEVLSIIVSLISSYLISQRTEKRKALTCQLFDWRHIEQSSCTLALPMGKWMRDEMDAQVDLTAKDPAESWRVAARTCELLRIGGKTELLLRFENTGSSPILEEDFYQPLRIDFGQNARIINVQHAGANPSSLRLDFKIDDKDSNALIFKPALFNQGNHADFIVTLTRNSQKETETSLVQLESGDVIAWNENQTVQDEIPISDWRFDVHSVNVDAHIINIPKIKWQDSTVFDNEIRHVGIISRNTVISGVFCILLFWSLKWTQNFREMILFLLTYVPVFWLMQVLVLRQVFPRLIKTSLDGEQFDVASRNRRIATGLISIVSFVVGVAVYFLIKRWLSF